MADFKLRAPPRVRFHGAVSFDGVFGAGGTVGLAGDAIARAVGQAALLRGMNLAGAGVASSQATAALLKGVRMQTAATAAAVGAANLSNILPASDIASFTVLSAVGGSDIGFSLGHPFPQGAVPAANYLSSSTAGVSALRADVKNRWPDGSVKFAILSGRANLSAAVPKLITISRAVADPGGTPVSIADLKATGITASIDYGAYGTVSWATTDWDSPFQWKGGSTEAGAAWIRNSVCSSWLYRKPIGSDAHLVGWLEVRCYASGAVEVVPWIENGYCKVASPGERSGTASFTLGGSQRFTQSLTLLNHTRSILASGTTYSHWLGTDPQLSWKHDRAYAISSKMLPNYGDALTSSNSLLSSLTTSFTPLAEADWTNGAHDMTASGGQLYVAPLPRWDVMYFLSGDIRAWRACQVNSMVTGRYGIHFRDENTNRPVQFLQKPNLAIPSGANTGIVATGGGSSTGDVIAVASGGTPPTYDMEHHGTMGYGAYLATGRFYFLEEMQFLATANYLKMADNNGRNNLGSGSDGIFDMTGPSATIPRGAWWSVRSLACATSITPDDDPLRDDLVNSCNKNADWWAARFTDSFNTLGIPWAGSGNDWNSGLSGYQYAPWQDHFGHAAVGMLRDAQVVTGGSITNLDTFLTWRYKTVAGRLAGVGGGSYFSWAANYDQSVGPTSGVDMNSPSHWYANWQAVNTRLISDVGEDYQGNALRGLSGADPGLMGKLGGYWGYVHAYAWAVDFGASGAQAGWNRLTGASNYATYAADFPNYCPEWHIVPRVASTALYGFVSGMSSGQWARFTSGESGLTQGLLTSSGGAWLMGYLDRGKWDSRLGYDKLLFIAKGAGPGTEQKVVQYDLAANAWSEVLPKPYWSVGNGHGYCHNAFDPVSGRFFYRDYGTQNVYVHDGAKAYTDNTSWSALPGASTAFQYSVGAGACEWFPEGNRIIMAGRKQIVFGNLGAGTWTQNGATRDLGDNDTIAQYSAVHGCVYVGGGHGDATSRGFYRVNANLTIDQLADCPITFGIAETASAIEPVSGDLLLKNEAGQWARWNGSAWSQPSLGGISMLVNSGGCSSFTMGAPYNCIVYIIYNGGSPQMWIYKA